MGRDGREIEGTPELTRYRGVNTLGTFLGRRCLTNQFEFQTRRLSMNKPDLNVTPLIDVLLVLLIIFMVVSPVKPSKFDARIPREPKDEIAEVNPKTLIVTLDPTMSLTLNTEKLDATVASADALIDRLKNVFEARSRNMETERTVFIKAPKSIDYGTVAKVVDAVKQSGAAPISLQIDRLD